MLRSIEICAGAGGQALGLEQAGFSHVALVEIDPSACATLRDNRPTWNVIEADLRLFSAKDFASIELLAGGVPCPPFSIAGKQLGATDERDLFPEALRLVSECRPKAIMLENVRGLFAPKFDSYRAKIIFQLENAGYQVFWKLIEASHFGVSQHRVRSVLVALKKEYARYFSWPLGILASPPTVGQLLLSEMQKQGWQQASAWAEAANDIAPTIVGGSKKHGGPDLGPTRSKEAWKKLGVDARGVADAPPQHDFRGAPRLTVKMAALLQGFPSEWKFSGKKTPAYKQVGNAFPPPVARAVARSVKVALEAGVRREREEEEVAIAV